MFNDISYKINSSLPYKPFNMISGTERYGFTSLLSEQIGLNWRPRPFATWLHGWMWWGAKSSTELHFDSLQKETGRFIVSKFSEKKVLEAEGFKNLWVGGLPFAYTTYSGFKRLPGSLLAMPPHSSEREKMKKPYIDYLNYLESLKPSFSNISVCIHYLDLSEPLKMEINKRGFYLIEGARPDDLNSIKRMRAIFDSFEYVTTNTMGSHVIYAIFSGCKVSLCGPFYKFDESDFIANDSQLKHSDKYISDLLHYLSVYYLKKNFPFITVNNPRNGFFSEIYARKEIGYSNKLDNNVICDVLRWRFGDQITGYYQGAMQRLLRKIRS